MEVIMGTIISGLFSLGAIWYQNYLQKKSPSENTKTTLSNISEAKTTTAKRSPILSIVFTLVIVVCPLLLLLVVGKERVSGGDKYLMEYYFIWVIITIVAILIGWKRKTMFEKIVLILSLIFLIYMTFEVMSETKRNANYQQDQMQSH